MKTTPLMKRFAPLAIVLTLLLPSLASAQLTASDTGRCINAINKGMRKVTSPRSRTRGAASPRRPAELLGAQTVLQCIAAGPGVQKATISALIAADNSCDGVPPAFGPQSINLHGTRAVQITQAFMQDLFGTTPDPVLATNSLVMGCQSTRS